MMTAANWSARCSTRVARFGHEPTDNRAPGQYLAPECLTAAVRPASPEGGPAAATGTHRSAGRGPGRHNQRERAERLHRRLSPRDLALLARLDAHRFLTTSQLAAFEFAEHRSPAAAGRICRRVLARLQQQEAIEHLERRVGGVRAGSASYVWRLAGLGDQLLRLQRPERPRARRKEPSLRHLEHCLASADVHLSLLALVRAGRLELLSVVTEPACWRRYLSLGGGRETLKPDLFAVTAQGEFEDHWFIEVDRATESLPTLLAKCAQYEDYRRSGVVQADGGVFPLVVWVLPDERHVGKLRAAITASRRLDPNLYRICTPASFSTVITGASA